MMNLDLMINYCNINLGKKIDHDIIQEAKLNKLGFFSAILLRKPKGTIVYCAKNCNISCFGTQVVLIPRLKSSDGPFIFGTSAFLYTAKNVIYKIVYQLLDNKDMALSEFRLFTKTCSNIYGVPKKQHEKLCIWEDEMSAIICELSNNGKNHFVYWLLMEPVMQSGYQPNG
jgi:hypothetical protein